MESRGIWKLSPKARVDRQTLDGEYQEGERLAVYYNRELRSPAIAQDSQESRQILGISDEQKRIEVDLTNQKLYAFEGDRKVYEFVISSGKPWWATPTGVFRIWIKLRYTKMEGGSKALGTYYYLPNVPYVMYFYNSQVPKWRGYGLHGTYWHNNFGNPMSHGCVNMRTEDIAKLYYWARPDLRGKSSILASDSNLGTPVIIYGETPQ